MLIKKYFIFLTCLITLFSVRTLKAEGPPLPYTLKDACEGEGCSSGSARNCHLPYEGVGDETIAYENPSKNSKIIFKIKASDTAAVKFLQRNILVKKPYKHQLTQQDLAQSLCENLDSKIKLKVGDSIYVLSYAGEGSFIAWYKQKLISCDPRVMSETKYSDKFDTAQREPWCKVQLKDKVGWITNTHSKKYL